MIHDAPTYHVRLFQQSGDDSWQTFRRIPEGTTLQFEI